MLDREELVRHCDRRLKIRTLQAFEESLHDILTLERDFAALVDDLTRWQPVMGDLAGIDDISLVATVPGGTA